MKKQLLRAAASTVLGLSLTTGFAAADINTTGPGSDNTVKTTVKHQYKVSNNNDLSIKNSNSQRAYTGDAKASYNTTAGDATSGNATNSNSLNASATVSNNSAAGISAAGSGASVPTSGSISNTGPGSDNKITTSVSSSVKVNNDNDLKVSNTNTQTASSGDAKVSGNTTGGSATSGAASNSNSSSFTLNVSN